LKHVLVAQWILPKPECKALKADENKIYLTFYNIYQIYVVTKTGKLITKFGDEYNHTFNEPIGLAVDKTSLYVCDYWTHRILILSKKTGKSCSQFGSQGIREGQFTNPYSIYLSEDVLYVGDRYSIQLYTTLGTFMQRVGDDTNGQFYSVRGIMIVNDKLYVSDCSNQRIKVYRVLK